MADDWLKEFSEMQIRLIQENTNPKSSDESKRSWADITEEAQRLRRCERSCFDNATGRCTVKCAHSSDKWDSELCKSVESSKEGVGAPSTSSADVEMMSEDAEMEEAASESHDSDSAESTQGEHGAESSKVPKLYSCEGSSCRDEEGNRRRYERRIIMIVGFRRNGKDVPGMTWAGMHNRFCRDCFLAKYMSTASPEEIEDYVNNWPKKCKQSHRKADKYHKRNLRNAQEAEQRRKVRLSQKQQFRCDRWVVAKAEIAKAYPDTAGKALRKLVLTQVQTAVSSLRKSFILLGETAQQMIEEAKKARLAMLKKLVETGECDLPHGEVLKDGTLQFLSDLTPDGKNKELFLCRRCGFVAGNHVWYQGQNHNGPLHHFRCRFCFAEYYPWKRDNRFCKFNKVLVNENPSNPAEFIVTPAWWEKDAEQAFINRLKEFTLKIQSETFDLSEVKYDNITKFISEKVVAGYAQITMFEKVAVPGPWKERICNLHDCKNYAHCSIEPDEVEGFFFKNHMEVTEEQIFTDFDVLCNEITSCLNMDNK